jgi:hypothetical protein
VTFLVQVDDDFTHAYSASILRSPINLPNVIPGNLLLGMPPKNQPAPKTDAERKAVLDARKSRRAERKKLVKELRATPNVPATKEQLENALAAVGSLMPNAAHSKDRGGESFATVGQVQSMISQRLMQMNSGQPGEPMYFAADTDSGESLVYPAQPRADPHAMNAYLHILNDPMACPPIKGGTTVVKDFKATKMFSPSGTERLVICVPVEDAHRGFFIFKQVVTGSSVSPATTSLVAIVPPLKDYSNQCVSQRVLVGSLVISSMQTVGNTAAPLNFSMAEAGICSRSPLLIALGALNGVTMGIDDAPKQAVGEIVVPFSNFFSRDAVTVRYEDDSQLVTGIQGVAFQTTLQFAHTKDMHMSEFFFFVEGATQSTIVADQGFLAGITAALSGTQTLWQLINSSQALELHYGRMRAHGRVGIRWTALAANTEFELVLKYTWHNGDTATLPVARVPALQAGAPNAINIMLTFNQTFDQPTGSVFGSELGVPVKNIELIVQAGSGALTAYVVNVVEISLDWFERSDDSRILDVTLSGLNANFLVACKLSGSLEADIREGVGFNQLAANPRLVPMDFRAMQLAALAFHENAPAMYTASGWKNFVGALKKGWSKIGKPIVRTAGRMAAGLLPGPLGTTMNAVIDAVDPMSPGQPGPSRASTFQPYTATKFRAFDEKPKAKTGGFSFPVVSPEGKVALVDVLLDLNGNTASPPYITRYFPEISALSPVQYTEESCDLAFFMAGLRQMGWPVLEGVYSGDVDQDRQIIITPTHCEFEVNPIGDARLKFDQTRRSHVVIIDEDGVVTPGGSQALSPAFFLAPGRGYTLAIRRQPNRDEPAWLFVFDTASQDSQRAHS